MEMDHSLLDKVRWIAIVLAQKRGAVTAADLFAGLYIEARGQISQLWETDYQLDVFAKSCKAGDFDSVLAEVTAHGNQIVQQHRNELREQGMEYSGLGFSVEVEFPSTISRILSHIEILAKGAGRVEPNRILTAFLLDPDFRVQLQNSGMNIALLRRAGGRL